MKVARLTDPERKCFADLADELEREGDPRYKKFIGELRELWYDDFANPPHIAAPKIQMAARARDLGREDIAQRVINGDFDQ